MLFEDRRLFCMKARQLISCLEEIRATFLVPTANHHPGKLCGLAAMPVAIQYRGFYPDRRSSGGTVCGYPPSSKPSGARYVALLRRDAR